MDKLRRKSRTKLDRLETKLEKERRELEEDRADYKGRKSEELLLAGDSIIRLLGLFGSRRSSALSSAARKRRMTTSAKADIEESVEEIERLEEDIRDLEKEVREEAETIAEKWESIIEEESMLQLKPRRTDVQIVLVAPAWSPVYHFQQGDGSSHTRVPTWSKPDPAGGRGTV